MDQQAYTERVYAGVLGKLIGVYSGRPIEGWSYERIRKELEEVRYYVNDRLGIPLIVTDDDLAGTFTFPRAVVDHDGGFDITSRDIGLSWRDYILEGRTTLWWGGKGVSTEHTAFLNLCRGIEAPESGSAKVNGHTVAEQIGAQIFIDGWAMIAPGRPDLASKLAGEAARVSHDLVAVHAAQLLAAMESLAFIENDIWRLLEQGLALLPKDSAIIDLAEDITGWVQEAPEWREVRGFIEAKYGYDRYPGNCHVIPNHAIVLLSLLACQDDFQEGLTIANTSGWDTDCNAGNVGCLMGIKNGLSGLDADDDFRTPVADRLFVPSADLGEAVTDAVREAIKLVNIRASLNGDALYTPKDGARFHFELPGSVQGFMLEGALPHRPSKLLRNVEGRSLLGKRSLMLDLGALRPDRPTRISSPTFATKDVFERPGYGLVACPTLYQGQTLTFGVVTDTSGLGCVNPFVSYDAPAGPQLLYGPPFSLEKNKHKEVAWRLPVEIPGPILTVGLEVGPGEPLKGGLFIDHMTWTGMPTLKWREAALGEQAWQRAWTPTYGEVVGNSDALTYNPAGKNGMVILGSQNWQDYRLLATLRANAEGDFGVAVHVRGQLRYIALRASDGVATLARRHFGTTLYTSKALDETKAPRRFEMRVRGSRLSARVDSTAVADDIEIARPLSGAAAVVSGGAPVDIIDFEIEPLS